ncbi:MAG: nucleotide pyrophosphohydrolase [Clostridiaceae bacterium]|jgi:NTP pyrophosphatase (non-canonical NTP hydrolase)|nr:nucleotide pyrophosphohydrolase [Bacillota bacterium]NLN51727.1 nucleotide pyrophosphohydrolase [Clostridiaceae bacterium]
MDQIKRVIRDFISERDWDQFHSPANLSKSICIEAAELLENFQWDEDKFDFSAVQDELADILIYCFQLADKLALDVESIMLAKMKQNQEKYPVQKAKGTAQKYTEF